MRDLLARFRPLWNAEGGGAGSAGTDSPAAGGSGSPPPSSPGGEGGQPANPAQPGGTPAAGAGAPAPAAPYRPDGLPDTMFGASDRETIDKMHKSLQGYRERDASRGVPTEPAAYTKFELDKVPEAVRPHIEQLSGDPVFQAAAKVALEDRVPVPTMQKLTTALYTAAAEAGILEPPIDVAAERTQLLPEAARNLPKAQQDAAIDARMQANEDFVNLLARPGPDGKAQLDAKDAEHVKLMLMDSAAGNRFLEFFRAQMTGQAAAQPLAGAGAAGGQGGQRAELKARLESPEMQPGHPKFDRAAHAQLMADYQRVVGQ